MLDGNLTIGHDRLQTVVYRRDGQIGIGNTTHTTSGVVEEIASRVPESLSDVDYVVLGVATITDEDIAVKWYEDVHNEERQKVRQ